MLWKKNLVINLIVSVWTATH